MPRFDSAAAGARAWLSGAGSTMARAYLLYFVTLIVPALVAMALFIGHEVKHNSALIEGSARTMAVVLAEAIAQHHGDGNPAHVIRVMSKALAGSTNGVLSLTMQPAGGGAPVVVRGEATDLGGAPDWMVRLVEDGLSPVSVPVEDAGRVLGRLSLDLTGAVIADDLWLRLHLAVVVWMAGLALGLVLMRVLLRQLLGPLARVQRFERDFRAGMPDAAAALTGSVPVELRATFDMLEHITRDLREKLREREQSLARLQGLLLRLVPASSAASDMEREDMDVLAGTIDRVIAEREGAQLRSRLQAMLSHEFRTPLSVIVGVAEVLSRQDAAVTPERQAQLLVRLRRAAERLNAMVEDAMVISRLGAGGQQPEIRPIALPGFLAAVVDGLPDNLEATARMVLKVPPSCARVCSDERLLEHVLTNLLSNALKFSAAGSLVTLAVNQLAGALELRVKDSGIGIPADELNRVFEPFYRGRGAELFRGTGLGLTVVRSAIERLGGQIGMASTPGEGTSVTVRVPNALLPE